MTRLTCFLLATLTLAASSGLCRAEEQREQKPRFKGVELYSWKDPAGDWLFVLMDGTNDLKTEQRIKGFKPRFKGAQEAGKAIARLAQGEQVIWVDTIQGFELPPEAVRKAIAKAAKDSRIDLSMPGE